MSDFSINSVRPETSFQGLDGKKHTVESKVTDTVNASDTKTDKFNTPVKIDKAIAQALNDAGIEKPGGGKWKEGDKIFTTGKGKAHLEIDEMFDGAFGNKFEVKKGHSPTVELGKPTIK